MPMLKQLKEALKKFLSTLMHNILATIVVGIIGIPLLSWATGTLDILLQILISPTPLWATILLVGLCCFLVYQIIVHSQRSLSTPSPQLHSDQTALKVLRIIAFIENPLDRDELSTIDERIIAAESGLSEQETKYYLGSLLNEGYVDYADGELYGLTNKGRALLKQNNMLP